MRNSFIKILREHRALLCFVLLMTAFRSSFADWNTVPTGSMKPTILEGDRILVNKMAYDFRVPFIHVSLNKISDPERGDIVVFDSENSGIRLVKRVIGIPGDTIEMNNNVLRINGESLSYETISTFQSSQDRLESLLGKEHYIRVQDRGSPLSSFLPVKIPDDYYLALGDNRDNSSDSRVIGLVPRAEIVGRTKSVVWSHDHDNNYIPRSDRFFKALDLD